MTTRVLFLLLFCAFFCQSFGNFPQKHTGDAHPEPENWDAVLLEEVNRLRKTGCQCPGNDGYFSPAPPLTWNPRLAKAAQRHADDMARRNYFDHKSKDGRNFSDRVEEAGYDWRAVAENLAWGYRNPKDVVLGWKNSSGHCKNLMNSTYTEMGAGLNGAYWVQDLARPL